MASKGTFQQVIIIGNACSDPEVRYTASGKAVANLTLATNESWKDKQTGQESEKSEFHRVCIFGKLAEICGEYVRKGSKVQVVGKLQTRKWQDQQGQDKYTTEIVLDPFNGVMQMLGGGQQSGQPHQSQQPAQNAPQKQNAPQNQHGMNPPNFEFDDDLPPF